MPEFATIGETTLSTNLFAYCENDCVNKVDSTGKAWYFNFKPYMPSYRTLRNIYDYLTIAISNIKWNSITYAKKYIEKSFYSLKSRIRISKSTLNKLADKIRITIRSVKKITVKILVLLVEAFMVMCKTSITVAKKIWNWFTKTKAGQITWNAIWVVVSLAGLIVSIIGCGSPASAIGIAGIVLSAISLLGSIISLIMAII